MRTIIFGCGGHAISIMNTLLKNDKAADIFIVDKNAKPNEKFMGFSACCSYTLNEDDCYLVAVGDNNTRRELYEMLKSSNKGNCISIISNVADIGIGVTVGEGSFVAPCAYVGPYAVIGNNTIINTGSVIEHETVIGNHTHIAPHATICGRSRIGNNVFCGAGSVVIDRIRICDDVIIGAGSVVIEDIVEAGTYVGAPAKKINWKRGK